MCACFWFFRRNLRIKGENPIIAASGSSVPDDSQSFRKQFLAFATSVENVLSPECDALEAVVADSPEFLEF